MSKQKLLKKLLAVFLSIVLATFILTLWLPFLKSLQLLTGSLFVLFIPGYIWSWYFWKKDSLDYIERAALSIALSLVGVPLFLFILNKVGLAITPLLSVIEISALCISGLIILYLQKKNSAKINLLRT